MVVFFDKKIILEDEYMSYHNKGNNGLPLIITLPAIILLPICFPLSIIWVLVGCWIGDNL